MASVTLSFQINSEKLDLLTKHQKKRGKARISPDLFAKELVLEKLDELEMEASRRV
jgi:hypothetical protein